MSRRVLVAMGPDTASENALEYALKRHPNANISVIHVTGTSDPLGLFGDLDPSNYLVPDCEFGFDEELMLENSFTQRQRRRAEYVFDRACEISDTYGKEIEPVVKSGEPVAEIVAYTEEQAINHIVIGNHPWTELRPVLRVSPNPLSETPVSRSQYRADSAIANGFSSNCS